MAQPDFRKAAVIGTGMMGPGIAGTLALSGLHATIISRMKENAVKGLHVARAQIRLLADNGLVEGDRASRAAELLSATANLEEAVSAADITIESAPENMAFKQDLFARLDSIARPDAILTSNTSGLSITAIASRCRHQARVMTTHFWNPPHLMPLVEVVKGDQTSHDLAVAVKNLLARCGKVPVLVKKDRPGQLGNRLQMALVREAVNIVQEGIADVEEVDLAASAGFGLRLPVYGILEHQDVVGLDMGLGIVDYVTQDLNNEPKAPDLMRKLVAENKLGAKTGGGFYDWSRRDITEVRARRDRFVLDFLKSRRAVSATQAK
jgi:3-hydroxybutyryl-CoA dehydrogenase